MRYADFLLGLLTGAGCLSLAFAPTPDAERIPAIPYRADIDNADTCDLSAQFVGEDGPLIDIPVKLGDKLLGHTDAEGRFEHDEGPCTVDVHVPGFTPLRARDRDLPYDITNPTPLTVEVVDTSGRPVEGVEVSARYHPAGLDEDWAQRLVGVHVDDDRWDLSTDADGLAHFVLPARERFTFYLYADVGMVTPTVSVQPSTGRTWRGDVVARPWPGSHGGGPIRMILPSIRLIDVGLADPPEQIAWVQVNALCPSLSVFPSTADIDDTLYCQPGGAVQLWKRLWHVPPGQRGIALDLAEGSDVIGTVGPRVSVVQARNGEDQVAVKPFPDRSFRIPGLYEGRWMLHVREYEDESVPWSESVTVDGVHPITLDAPLRVVTER